MLRIGIFTECYRPVLNGVVVSIDTFKEELEKLGHKVYVFAPKSRGYQDNSPSVFRYPAIPLPKTKDYSWSLTWLAPLQKAKIKDLNLDIIHSQHIFWMGRFGLRLGRILDVPVVHTYHTLITEYTHYVPILAESTKKGFLIKRSRSYCNQCNQLVTPSSAMKEVLRSYGVTTPIEVIPTGTYLDDFQNPFHKEVLRERWQIPEGKKILLYVSRVAKEKNLGFLFRAIKKLSLKRDDFHLLVVGGGPELGNFQELVQNWNLESQVTFTDMQEKKQANRFFGAADIFVFPSITETQGIVITEAMAAGIPAVAVNEMGPKDLIQNGVDGFLTPLKIEQFSAKIEKLLDSEKLRAKFSRNARKNAGKFSAQICGKKMEDLYEKTIANYANHRS